MTANRIEQASNASWKKNVQLSPLRFPCSAFYNRLSDKKLFNDVMAIIISMSMSGMRTHIVTETIAILKGKRAEKRGKKNEQ
jgi:hypothetical protein